MTVIGRLSSQILVAIEAADVTAGPKPADASSAHLNESPLAGFGAHLADLAQREIQSNALDGYTSDSGSSPPALTRLGFSPAVRPAETTHYSAGISTLDKSEAKPRDLMVPSAAMTESRPGSKMHSARADMLSPGGNPPPIGQPDNSRGPKPRFQREVGASVHNLPVGIEKPVEKTNSLEDSLVHASANNSVLAIEPQHISTRASRATEDSPPDPRQFLPVKGSLGPVSANEASLLVAGALTGAFSRASRPDLVPAEAGEDGSRVALASGQTSVADSGSFNCFRTGRLDLDERFFADANWDRDLDIASFVPLRVIAAGQETHLVQSKELSLRRQITALNQLSSRAGEAGSKMVPEENLPQTANFDRNAADARIGGNHFASIPIEPNGSHDPWVISSVRTSASSVNVPGDSISCTEISPAGNIAALTEPSFRGFAPGVVGSSTVPGKNLPETANHGLDAAGAQLPGNELESISVEQKGSHDSLVIPSLRTLASAGNERGDVHSATVLSLAETNPASGGSSARANLVGDSTILKESMPQTDAQLGDNYPASVPAELTGVRGASGTSSIQVSPSAVHEQARPVSVKLLSPVMQIANLIVAPADFGGSVSDRIGAQPEPAIRRAEETLPSASRVQILHLKLEPENLGKVTVKMRLAGPKLELHVEAERPETVRLIGNDKELLSGKLQSAGYAIDTLVIRTADSQGPQPGLAAGTGTGQDQQASHANGGPTAHDRPSMREDNSHSHPILEDDAKDTHRIHAADGELYL